MYNINTLQIGGAVGSLKAGAFSYFFRGNSPDEGTWWMVDSSKLIAGGSWLRIHPRRFAPPPPVGGQEKRKGQRTFCKLY